MAEQRATDLNQTTGDSGTGYVAGFQRATAGSFSLLRRVMRNPKGLFGIACLVILILVAIFSPLVARTDPNTIDPINQLAPVSTQHWFGADELGRDIFSRVVFGTRPALMAGLTAVLLAAIVGTITGIIAGYMGGAFDAIIMRLWDTLLAFPAIFLAIGIVSVLGPGRFNAIIAIAIINMPIFSRVVRAATLGTRSEEFITAARAIGCSHWRVMFVHVLPNAVVPGIVLMAIAVPEAILIEATLSFLGLGSQPPAASWGNMLSNAQAYLSRSFTYAVFPGLAITFTVVGMMFFADALQDAIDPRRDRSSYE